MEKRERLDAVISGKQADRPPMLGGWLSNPRLLAIFAGVSFDEYKRDPQAVSIRAYSNLGVDGLIDIVIAKNHDDYRVVDHESYVKADYGYSYEETEEKVCALPEPDDIESVFDFEKEYALFKNDLVAMQQKCGDMVYMPANWGAGARAGWFSEYGYENFFLLVGLRPDLAAKLFRIGGAQGRCQARLVARAIEEGLFPKALLFGEDICTQRGPMISVDFLKEYYAPALSYGLEPLLKAGCRPVWHCDGDVRVLLPMLLDCGVGGFQGFQPECGMHLEEIANLQTKAGEKLLIFGPLSVTTELPVLSPEQVRTKVRYYNEVCRDKADLVFLTSNTMCPDVPAENILAMYDEIAKL